MRQTVCAFKKHASMKRLIQNRPFTDVVRNPTSYGVTVAVHSNNKRVTYSHRRTYHELRRAQTRSQRLRC